MTERGGDAITESEDSRALTEAFATELSLTVQTGEELRALTASIDGGDFWALVVNGPKAFFVAYCTTLGALSAKGTSSKLGQVFHRRQVIFDDGSVRAVLDPDLPPEAFEQLAQPSPAAPSGELVYDREARRWKDSAEP